MDLTRNGKLPFRRDHDLDIHFPERNHFPKENNLLRSLCESYRRILSDGRVFL